MSANLLFPPVITAMDDAGVSVPGAELFAFVKDTTTPAYLYTDETLQVPHPTPVVADAAGRFPAMWYNSSSAPDTEIRKPTGELISPKTALPSVAGSGTPAPTLVKSTGTDASIKAIQRAVCVLQSTGAGQPWNYIDDSSHKPVNFASGLSVDGPSDPRPGALNVPLAFTGSFVGAAQVTADESYASLGVTFGASVAQSALYIYAYMPLSGVLNLETDALSVNSLFGSNITVADHGSGDGSKVITHPTLSSGTAFAVASDTGAAGGYENRIISSSATALRVGTFEPMGGRVYYDGAAWQYEGSNLVAPTIAFASNTLTITYTVGLGADLSQRTIVTNNQEDNTRTDVTLGATAITIQFDDNAGTLLTAPTTDMDVSFTNPFMVQADTSRGQIQFHGPPAKLDMNDIGLAGANIWVTVDFPVGDDYGFEEGEATEVYPGETTIIAKSAYQSALDTGFDGSEQEWIQSLNDQAVEDTTPLVAQAETARNEAQAAAATAEAVSGPNYANTTAGLAATTSGQTFAVDNGDGTVTVYLNSSGVAQAQRSLATTSAIGSASGAGLVGFQQDGTGTVARTVDDKLNEAVSVQDFGAVGDGTTNDAAAIQLALTNTPTGGTLLFPSGKTYRVSATVTIPKNLTLDATDATFSGEGLDSNDDLFTAASAIDVKVRGGNFQNCRHAFRCVTAFDSLIIEGANFSNSAIPVLVHDVSAPSGRISITNCKFDGAEIGVDIQSAAIGSVNISNNRFQNIAAKTLTSRPSPLDKRIVAGLWYQAILSSAGPSSVIVMGNSVDGVTGPAIGVTNEKEVHGLGVSLDNTEDTSIIMIGNDVRNTAGHSTLDVGDEGLMARARSVMVCNNYLLDAGSTEGCIYAKGSTYHKVEGNIIEATLTNPRLSYMAGVISTGTSPNVSNNKFINLPEGIKTRATKATYLGNEFFNVDKCIVMGLEDGTAHEYTRFESNVSDADCATFFSDETDDSSTATTGDLIFQDNTIYCTSAALGFKNARDVKISGGIIRRGSPNSTRELFTLRAEKTIQTLYMDGVKIPNFDNSLNTGRIFTITNVTATGLAQIENIYIHDCFFGVGQYVFFANPARNYENVVITGNETVGNAAMFVWAGASTYTGLYEITNNLGSNFDTRRQVTADIEDATHPVNTSNTKTEGFMVFNTTTNQPVYATGDAATSTWADATGTTAHTPV